MSFRPKMHLLLPLLVWGMALAPAASVDAMGRQEQGSGNATVSLNVNFRTTPHWVGVEGTQVMTIREAERPGYDMFRYGNYYYVYDNNRWYRSRQWRGRFFMIEDRIVPGELRRVPRHHWRHYPMGWEDRNAGGSSAYLEVTFGSRPRWTGIRGTRVEYIPEAQRPGYDVFRYGGTYYAYDNNRWYSSNRESGRFMLVDERVVPGEFRSVPREHWRSYPAAWHDQNQNGTPPGLAKKGGNPPGQEKRKDNRNGR